jgi:hypothetical protein
MKHIALALVTVLFGTATIAQTAIAPKTLELLEKAKITQGGKALENLKTYQEKATLTIYQNGAVAGALDGLSLIDFSKEQVRLELSAAGELAQIIQVAPNDSWTWTAASGTVKLPLAQAKPIRDTLYQGSYALRLDTKELDAATSNGMVELPGGLKGESVTISTKGALSNLVFSTDGTLIGSKVEDTTSVYGDFRMVDGIKIPFSGKTYQGTELYLDAATSNVLINPSFTNKTFAKPK